VATTDDDLSLRLDRLERDVRRLAAADGGRRREDLVSQLSFLGWLKLSGPTFAVMVFGFTLLWQSQQALSAQGFETSRSLGRLEGTIAGLDQRMEQLDARLDGLSSRLDGLDARLAQLAAAIERLSERVDRLGP
jgi:septal ring factor EnvC (AmiA/AmiB activator)